MENKFILQLNYKSAKTEFIVDIDGKKLNKFVEDSLSTFDEVLRNIIALEKFNKAYDLTDDEQKVVIDGMIDSLQNDAI